MGGGGGGGGYFGGDRPLDRLRDESVSTLKQAETEAEIGQYLTGLLGRINERNVELTSERLAAAIDVLGDEASEPLELRFGGSVAKHTYVDGLSDTDALVVGTQGEANEAPESILRRFADTLARNLLGVKVEPGRLAVTL